MSSRNAKRLKVPKRKEVTLQSICYWHYIFRLSVYWQPSEFQKCQIIYK